ncbi:nitrate- and nitrite sensing domain-containing protein [Nocardia sp. NBC_01503]|uniref:sensor histidine kinase n=1 Tax=Nocardia sp. NBC_01503 TaxID=2975997 RepID=UPI002E7ABAA3|nr:nitrate- and nitrite sensing domain-containing protein [Nocardia sp. NBC_01503]WTL31277.1 nitrate- and nitrite sensing domain-containing protein [Nocardia sp. NBC_01503]
MFRARLGVRTRVLAIALVPSLALLVIGVGGAGYLVVEGKNAREWADALTAATPLSKELVSAVQLERQLTMAQLAGDEPNPKTLTQARTRLDNALRGMSGTTKDMENLGPQEVTGDVGGFLTLTRSLAAVRTQIDGGALPLADAYNFYGHLLDLISIGTRAVETTAPNPEIAMETAATLEIVSASEMLSRADSLAEVLLKDGTLTPDLAVEFSRVLGAYRVNIGVLAGADGSKGKPAFQAVVNDPNWQKLIMMENVLLSRALDPMTAAPVKAGATQPVAPLTFTPQEWHDTVNAVNKSLLDMWDAQSRYSLGVAADVADKNARNSAIAGGAMLLVSLSAFLVALLLANRIIGRLKRLRDQTFVLADERLPEIMSQLRDGKQVEISTETPELDFGTDEIGQVAKAFGHAHTAAVSAAVTEARTREGVKAVFLNIAHRSQVVVHRQLEVLDEAEAKQEDPTLLEIFFRLDHLATRERRNAENLIILAGGQPGRQWRNPVQLIELVRSGVGEALDYTRVKITRLPEVAVAGSAVADLIHLLAELVDNAAHFSPPSSQVEVRGNVVGKGIAIEIVDQGMGMPEAEFARINDMLRNPPDFGVNTLSEDSRLGMFVVAQLAVRNGISVRLAESDYGGVRAIVLVPSSLTVSAGRTGEIPAVPTAFDTGQFHAALAAETARQLEAQQQFEASKQFEAPNAPEAPKPIGNPGPFESPRQLEPPAPASFSNPALPARPEPLAPERQMSFDTPRPFEPPTHPSTNRPQYIPPAPAPRQQPENDFRAREFDRSQYTGSDVRPELPRRRRQASLAPELAQEKAAQESPEQPTRTAEQARDLFSAIENGTRQGRRADPGAVEPVSHPFQDRQEGDGDHLKRW